MRYCVLCGKSYPISLSKIPKTKMYLRLIKWRLHLKGSLGNRRKVYSNYICKLCIRKFMNDSFRTGH